MEKSWKIMLRKRGHPAYDYLPNHNVSLLIGWYQIILLSDTDTCANNLPRIALDSAEASD